MEKRDLLIVYVTLTIFGELEFIDLGTNDLGTFIDHLYPETLNLHPYTKNFDIEVFN